MPFPTRATAKFNWNMMFAPQLGEDALPRQFYLLPPTMHINKWATSAYIEKNPIYDEIVSVANWKSIQPQFPSSHARMFVRPIAPQLARLMSGHAVSTASFAPNTMDPDV